MINNILDNLKNKFIKIYLYKINNKLFNNLINHKKNLILFIFFNF